MGNRLVFILLAFFFNSIGTLAQERISYWGHLNFNISDPPTIDKSYGGKICLGSPNGKIVAFIGVRIDTIYFPINNQKVVLPKKYRPTWDSYQQTIGDISPVLVKDKDDTSKMYLIVSSEDIINYPQAVLLKYTIKKMASTQYEIITPPDTILKTKKGYYRKLKLLPATSEKDAWLIVVHQNSNAGFNMLSIYYDGSEFSQRNICSDVFGFLQMSSMRTGEICVNTKGNRLYTGFESVSQPIKSTDTILLCSYLFDRVTGKIAKEKIAHKKIIFFDAHSNGFENICTSANDSFIYANSFSRDTADLLQTNFCLEQIKLASNSNSVEQLGSKKLSSYTQNSFNSSLALAPNRKILFGYDKKVGCIWYPDSLGKSSLPDTNYLQSSYTSPYCIYNKYAYFGYITCGGVFLTNKSDTGFIDFTWYSGAGDSISVSDYSPVSFKYSVDGKYLVKLKAIDKNGFTAWYSDSISVFGYSGIDTTTIPYIHAVSINENSDSLNVIWKPVAQSFGYIIHYDTGSQTKFTSYTVDTAYYLPYDNTYPKKYNVTIKAFDGCKNYTMSSAVSSSILLETLSNEPTKLMWNPYTNWQTASINYEIQTGNKASWSLLTNRIDTSLNLNFFEEDNIVSCYRVVALGVSPIQVSKSNILCINNEPSIFIPNAFTPNGDGLNDVWKVFTTGAERISFEIFDRWGEVIVAGSDVQAWDGNGYPSGLYYYRVQYTDKKGRHSQKGKIQLIR
jgi:gliding motility-associated-like protein